MKIEYFSSRIEWFFKRFLALVLKNVLNGKTNEFLRIDKEEKTI